MLEEHTVIIEKHDDWYVAYLADMPGVNTQGRTTVVCSVEGKQSTLRCPTMQQTTDGMQRKRGELS